MNVYILNADANQFEALEVVEENDMEAMIDGFRGLPMAKGWRPVPVEARADGPSGEKLRPGDFPLFGGSSSPVFSKRAVEALSDLLEGRGELLPLLSDDDEYSALNVTRLSDALDEERTTFERFEDGDVRNIAEYAFVPERLVNETVFKLPQIPDMYTFVTSALVERVRQRGLTGFLFQQVWEGSDDSRVSRSV